MQSRAERGLTLMHATPVAASQVEDEASPLLMCASASFSLFQAEEIVPRLGRCCGKLVEIVVKFIRLVLYAQRNGILV